MMHYAVTHQTAAEIVYDRADAEKPHMGLMTWKNAPDGRVVKSDVTYAYTRTESNRDQRNRNPLFYPLNYGCSESRLRDQNCFLAAAFV